MAAAIDIPDAPVSDFQTAPAATGLVSNLTGWPEATGTWSITEDGLVGQNLALADQFFLSGTQVTGDDSFSYEGDITLPAGEGQNAAGLVVWSSSGWYCVNVDRAGGVARLFKVGEGAWAAPDRPAERTEHFPSADGGFQPSGTVLSRRYLGSFLYRPESIGRAARSRGAFFQCHFSVSEQGGANIWI